MTSVVEYHFRMYKIRKKCSSDPEFFLKSWAEGLEFAKFVRSLEQFIQTVKCQKKKFVTEIF